MYFLFCVFLISVLPAPASTRVSSYSKHVPIRPAPSSSNITFTSRALSNPYPNMQAVTSPTPTSMSIRPSIPVSRPHDMLMSTLPRTLPHTILRPSKKTLLPCSIHCPGVSGFPSLSCSACHCLFHPKCVGLPPNFTNNGAPFDFFCNECKPMGGEVGTISAPEPIMSTQNSRQSLLKGSATTPKIVSNVNSLISASKKRPAPVEAARPIKKKVKAGPPPLRPIEGQTMVNIGGKKFLVIPRMDLELDSPPPSPPSGDMQPRRNEKLPVTLEPVDRDGKGGRIPYFTVEQTPDGHLIIKPAAEADPAKIFGSALKRSTEVLDLNVNKKLKSLNVDFHSALSSGYYALLHVFKYLGLEDKLRAAQVCKVWHELAFHPSIWTTISLKGIKVYDWVQLSELLNRVSCRHLDLRKIVFVKEREATWSDFLAVAPTLRTITHIQLPRIPGSTLAAIMDACSHLEIINAPLITSNLDTAGLSKLTKLSDIRLKAGAGNLVLEGGLKPLECLSGSLTKLSLLTVSGFVDSDYDVLGTLSNLEQIELGDCTTAPVTLFKTLSDLMNLGKTTTNKIALEGGGGINWPDKSTASYDMLDFKS